MSQDWGTNKGSSFIQKQHSDVYPAIDARTLQLPHNIESGEFNICIIGASRGIGAGIATAYAQAGASGIILASRRVSGLEETARRCREVGRRKDSLRLEIISCDVTKAADVEAVATKAKELFGGRLDVLALNSGTSGEVRLKLHEVPVDEFIQTTETNYLGTFLCAKFFVPLLLSSRQLHRSSAEFMIVSSWASLIVRGPIANAQYCNSKLAQLKLAEHIHEEYFAEGLRVYALHPGAVATEIALETAPEEFKRYLTDSPDLCGGTMASISAGNGSWEWMCGRFMDAKWDVEELQRRKEEVVKGNLLTVRMML